MNVALKKLSVSPNLCANYVLLVDNLDVLYRIFGLEFHDRNYMFSVSIFKGTIEFYCLDTKDNSTLDLVILQSCFKELFNNDFSFKDGFSESDLTTYVSNVLEMLVEQGTKDI